MSIFFFPFISLICSKVVLPNLIIYFIKKSLHKNICDIFQNPKVFLPSGKKKFTVINYTQKNVTDIIFKVYSFPGWLFEEENNH